MIRVSFALTASFILLASSAQAAMRPLAQQCAAWFDALDRNDDGTLSNGENARRFIDKITLTTTANGGDGDTTMSRAFFLKECAVGSFGQPQA